ncbi:MAG: hypothetical protein VX777_07600 [Chlamydiota bacterium]|nr:hypothetical protein [Chlamydiota bacterium]
MITFVTHFVKLNDEEMINVNKVISHFYNGDVYHHKNPMRLIRIMFTSVKMYHPECKLVILTDEDTCFDVDEDVTIVRSHRATDQLNFERMKARHAFLETLSNDNHLIFLDWDILIQMNLEHLFDRGDDLVLTYRRKHSIPINDGFFGVHRNSINKFHHFLTDIFEYYDNLPHEDYRKWWGFQMILNELFSGYLPTISNPASPFCFNFNGLQVALLRTDKYNASPKLLPLKSSFFPAVAVMHFKGVRKSMITDYWNRLQEVYAESKKTNLQT